MVYKASYRTARTVTQRNPVSKKTKQTNKQTNKKMYRDRERVKSDSATQ